MKKWIAFSFAVFMCLLLGGCKSSDYKRANELLAKEDYAGAVELLEGIEDYKDAATLLQDARQAYNYELAMQYLQDAQYDKAIELFENLGKYKDSPTLLVQAQKDFDYTSAINSLNLKYSQRHNNNGEKPQ